MAKRRAAGAPRGKSEAVLVVGLGRFGSALAESLVSQGIEVLAIDGDAQRVQDFSESLTHVVQTDSTSEEALRQLAAGDFGRAVVAIGSDREASILTVGLLSDLGVPEIWAKALSKPHGRILERVGAHHVVYPEFDMGQRVAHQVGGRMLDYMEVEGGFVLSETLTPATLVGKTLAESAVRSQHRVSVVCIKRDGCDFDYADPDTHIDAGDILIVAGPRKDVEKFAKLAR